MSRLLFVLFVALLMLAPPALGADRPWSSSILVPLVGALLLLWAVAALRDDRMLGVSLRWHWPATLLFGLLMAWSLMQLAPLAPQAWVHPLWAAAAEALGGATGVAGSGGAIGLTPDAGMIALMRVLSYGGVFWLALQLGRDAGRARAMLWALALAGFAYAAYGLVTRYGQGASTNFIDREIFAAYAGLTLLACLSLLLAELRAASRRGASFALGTRALVLSLLSLCIGTALFLTQSRGGLVSALIGISALLVGFAVARGLRRRTLLVYGAGVLAAIAWMAAFSGDAVIARLDGAAIHQDERIGLIRGTVRGVAERPLLGYGAGSFAAVFPMHQDPGIENSGYAHAHNGFLEVALSGGVAALAAMLALFGWIATVCFLGLLRRRHEIVYPVLALAAMAFIGAHAMVDFTVQVPAVAVTFSALLGIGYAQSWQHRKPRRRTRTKEPTSIAAQPVASV